MRNFTKHDTFFLTSLSVGLSLKKFVFNLFFGGINYKKKNNNNTESYRTVQFINWKIVVKLTGDIPKDNKKHWYREGRIIWFITPTITYFWIYKETSICNCFQRSWSFIGKTKSNKNLQMNKQKIPWEIKYPQKQTSRTFKDNIHQAVKDFQCLAFLFSRWWSIWL